MRNVGAHRMKNGMMLYHRSDRSVHLGGIGAKCGSMHDPRGKSGMAHFFEHLTCRISKTHSDGRENSLLFLKCMGGADGDINIRTDRWSTFYGCNDLFRRKHMFEIFDVMASFMHPRSRILDLEGAQVEAAAVHNEYCLRGVDALEMLLEDELHRIMYTVNPARNRVDCNIEELKTITLKEARQFARRYYVPKNMFVILLGPSFENAKELAERSFGDWEVNTQPTLDYDHSDDLPRFNATQSSEIIRPGIGQHHVAIGFPTEGYLSRDAESLDVLAKIMEFRLGERLREGNRSFDGGAYRTPVQTERSFAHGIFWMRFATPSRSFADSGEVAVLDELRKLKTDLVGRDEFDAAAYREFVEHARAFGSMPDVLSEMIIDAAANGDEKLVRLNTFPNRFRKVKRKTLCDVANKYFTKDYARVVIRPE